MKSNYCRDHAAGKGLTLGDSQGNKTASKSMSDVDINYRQYIFMMIAISPFSGLFHRSFSLSLILLITTIVVFHLFYYLTRSQLLVIKCMSKHQVLKLNKHEQFSPT